MPIAPEYRWLYPIDWPELSNLIRFRRAKGRCEHCRRPHGRDVLHLRDGTWWDQGAATWRDGQGRGLHYVPAPDAVPVREPGLDGIGAPPEFLTTRVVLASVHLNHDPLTRERDVAIWRGARLGPSLVRSRAGCSGARSAGADGMTGRARQG